MDKSLKLVKGDITTIPTVSPIDWTLCLLCEKVTDESLVCPVAHTYGGAGYKTLADNLKTLDGLGALPTSVKLNRLDEGDGLEATFINRHAQYHKKCALKYNDKNVNRAMKRKSSDDSAETPHKFTRKKAPQSDPAYACLFCNKSGTPSNPLHNASTADLDTKVRKCAINLQDQNLLAKLSRGDVVAIDMKYHAICLTSLYNRDRAMTSTSQQSTVPETAKNTAFAELLSYIQAVLDSDEDTPVFQLSELTKLYTSRVHQLEENESSSIHATRFKNKILGYFPELEAHTEGRDVLLVTSGTAGKSIKKTCQLDGESETVIMSRVAEMIRRDMFSKATPPFEGTFPDDCQKKSIPDSLLTLVTMILFGTNIKTEANYESQASLSLSQLLLFNSVRQKKTSTTDNRHRRDREPPLPLFLGACVHSKTRSKDLVDTLYQMGLSVSYDRVLLMSADLANAAINHFESLGAVCPPFLKSGVFTTSAVDNIDHDPTSTSAQTSFHGTGISLFQHPDSHNSGIEQPRYPLAKSSRKISKLPHDYTSVPAVVAIKDPAVPEVTDLQAPNPRCDIMTETQWCQHVCDAINTQSDLDNMNEKPNEDRQRVSWAAYHANRQDDNEVQTSLSALLPLFPDDSKSAAMIKHSMEVVQKAVTVLNPEQTPVIACDQPLYKLAKNIQWTWPETLGEDSYVVMLGGLHIKMTLLKCLGDLLDGSGWTSAISQAEVASSGTADSFLKASHVKKTARAHQVTACALYKLRQDAFTDDETDASFDDWSQERRTNSVQFKFWELILTTELMILTWDRAIHEGNFPLYVDTLASLQWIFHALDHHHYARAVAVHLRDMTTLETRHPSVYAEFCKGNFTVNRSSRPFSRMSLDESHEQNNACVKDEGGAVGLTEKPTALLRWMVAGPEMARVVTEFLSGADKTDPDTQTHHHEDNPGNW